MRRSPLKRKKPWPGSFDPGGGGGPTRRPKKPLSPEQIATNAKGRRAWSKALRRSVCASCGTDDGCQGHHVIYRQELRAACQVLELDYMAVRWDLRNMIPLCEKCHQNHHWGVRRVLTLARVRQLCPRIDEFAAELDRVWWLERTYA